MDDALENEIAGLLRDAQERRAPIEPFAHRVGPGDVERAYRIQQINTSHALARGRSLCGRKIGLTSRAVQEQLGVDEPDYGALFDDMRVAEGGEFSLSELIDPRIEAEIALIIADEIASKGLRKEQLAAKVAYAVPALEIVDSRLRDWRIGIVDTIADNGAAARFVLGPGQHSLKNTDLAACRMEMLSNGEVVSTGQGASSMGDPLNALAWLADTLIDHGNPLQPGYIVLTGALGPVVKMRSGDRIEARFDQLSPVSVNVR